MLKRSDQLSELLRSEAPKQPRGVITGCDENQELMLKWWWNSYSKCNKFPITFLDFGMTKSARAWCQKRGELISINLPPKIVDARESFPKSVQQNWEAFYTLTRDCDLIWPQSRD